MGNKLKTSLYIVTWLGIIGSLFFMYHQSQTIADADVVQEQESIEPTPVKITRSGTDVYIEMTAQITDIEIAKGKTYKAWTFNGEAPGPLLVVNEGDTLHFTLKNMDAHVAHSMDFHAVHTAPNIGYADVEPNEENTFVYQASNPGVFMYHCGTEPALLHIANGMHGVIIVKPKDGYPTDDEVDREFVVIENEWYKYNDIEDMTNGVPSYVVFSTKALHEGQYNTNGCVGALLDRPFQALKGEKIRFYVANMGPNLTSSFHVIGSQFDDVYIDGNPYNHMKGLQTVLLPASGGAVVEFTLKEAGEYKFVNHQFHLVQKGAVGQIIAYEGEIPELPNPEEQLEATNELHIHATNFEFDQEKYVVKAGEEVTINFTSDEGYHGLAIDEFRVHISGRGKATFTPDKPGEYKIYCHIYCGHGHERMIATLIVK